MNTLRGKLWLLVAVALAALSMLMTVALIGQSRSTEAVERALISKDVGADILPPPLYLVEMRLVLSMAMDGSMPLAQAKQEVQRLSSEYNARVTYWRGQVLDGLDTHLMGMQHTHGQAFMEATKPVLDAISSGDEAGAPRLLWLQRMCTTYSTAKALIKRWLSPMNLASRRWKAIARLTGI